MGKESRLKEMRKQLRNVTKEHVKDMFTQEFGKEMFGRLSKENAETMQAISLGAKNTLNVIDQRNKNFQNYMVRQISGAVPVLNATPEELAAVAPINETKETALTPDEGSEP